MIKQFNLFESTQNLETVATNQSYWSWEYDSHTCTAEILLDKTNNSLYLKIRDVHVKSGIGAGTFPRDLEFVKIGTLEKADLALVRNLLKKHGYDRSKFSTFWEDEEGNRMTLTDLLSLLKPEKPKKELKHIQPISTFQEPKIDNDIELVKYSDKAYALFGTGTKSIKEELKALGCRFNPFLTDPNTGNKKAGWIFPASKLNKIMKYLKLFEINDYSIEDRIKKRI